MPSMLLLHDNSLVNAHEVAALRQDTLNEHSRILSITDNIQSSVLIQDNDIIC